MTECVYICGVVYLVVCIYLFACAEDLFYLKTINAELFAVGAAGAAAAAATAAASNTVGKWLKFNWN